MEVFNLNAAIKLLDEVSPTVDQVNAALGDMEKALGVTRAEVEKNRQAMAEMAKVGQMTEFALSKMGITAEEYTLVLRQQAKAMDDLQTEALHMNKVLDETAAATARAEEMGTGWAVMLGTLGAQWLNQAVSSTKNFIGESVNLAVKLEMLEKATRFLGQQNGKTAEEVDALAASLNKQGITLVQSRENLLKMTQAGLDMSKATALARVAQDAGRIQNINSSDAMDRLVRGIVTQQTETLRGLGININAQEAQFRYAKSIGESSKSLTQAQKTQAMYNEVLEQGKKIAGTYNEMAGTAGGAALSMDRKRQDALTMLGQSFLEIRGYTIQWETQMWEMLTKFPDMFAKLAVAITTAGAAYGAFMANQKWHLMDKAGDIIKVVNTQMAASGDAALKAGSAFKSLFTVDAWKGFYEGLKNIASKMMEIKNIKFENVRDLLESGPDMSTLAGAAGGGFVGGAAVVAGAVAATAAIAALTDSLINKEEAHRRNSDAALAEAKNMIAYSQSTEESKKKIWEHLDAQKQMEYQLKVDRANLEEATANVGVFAGAWSLVKGAWDNLEIGSFTKAWGVLGFAIDVVLTPLALMKKALAGLTWAFTEARSGVEYLANYYGIFRNKTEELAQAQERLRLANVTITNVNKDYGQSFKTIAEAQEYMRTRVLRIVAAQEVAAKAAKEASGEARRSIEDDMKAQLELAKQQKLIEKMKPWMGKEKREKVTYEEALAYEKIAIEMGYIKKEVTEADKEMVKAKKTAQDFAKALENVALAAKKGIRKEKTEINVRAGKEAGPDEGILAAQEKAIEDGEAAVEAINKQLNDLRAKYKNGIIPPEVIQNYKEWIVLVRQNAKEKAEDIGSAGMLAAFKSLGPTIAEVTKQYNDMQAAMSKKITVEGGVLALDDSAIKTYITTMSKLQETNQLTAEQVAEMGPIFEEAFRRGIIGADQLAISTGKVSAEAVNLQSMFGATANQVADQFARIQSGIQASGGISNLLKINPAAGTEAINQLDKLTKSGLLTADAVKTITTQFVLAEQQGVKTTTKLTHEQFLAQQSSAKWGQALQGLISIFGSLGGVAGQALAGVAQIAGNAQQAFQAVGQARKDYNKSIADGTLIAGSQADTDAKASIAQQDFNAKLNAGADAAGLLGGLLSKSTNATTAQAGAALQGAAAGAKMGAAFGPIGAAVGAAAGAVFGWISAGKKMKAEVKNMYTEFEKANGGLEKMNARAKEAGVSLEDVMKNKGTKNVAQMKKAIEEANAKMDAFDDLLSAIGGKTMADLKTAAAAAGVSLKALFDAKTVDEYKTAAENVKKELESWNEANDALNSAMDKYGITIDNLGGKFKQAGFDKMGVALLKDFELLKAAGVDVSLITEKMSTDMSDYVNRAVAAGSTIPTAMKPVIDQMIAQGKLLDENGNAYGSLEEAGITFAQTLEEGIGSAVEAINKLVAVLAKGFNIPVDVYESNPGNNSRGGADGAGGAGGSGNPNRPNPQDDGYTYGSGGFRDFGRGTRTTLHGVEAVVRPEQLAGLAAEQGGYTGRGGNSTVVNLAISENPMQTAETTEQMRAFTLETVQRELSRSLAEAIEAGRA